VKSNDDGTFAYTANGTPVTATTVLAAGSYTLSVTFTPADTTDYTTATDTVQLTVNQATPVITWATPSAIVYGTALSGTQLDATANVAGSFVYSPAAGTVLNAGSQTLSVTFTPTDTTDYTTATASVTLQVNKNTPTITWANPAAITYGTALSGTQLNATCSVPATLVYSPAAGTVLNAGSPRLSVTCNPTDATDYTTATDSVTLQVNAASTTVTWSTPAAIAYGTPLSATQLDATANVAGTFVYSPAAGTVLNASATPYTLSVTFTPSSNNYNGSTGSITLLVNKAPQTITVTVPAPTYATDHHSFTVVASASSGLPITFGATPSIACSNTPTSSTTSSTYTMNSTTATCTETLSQQGSSNYLAAPNVVETTTPAAGIPPTVTFTGAPTSDTYESTFTVAATTNASTPAVITAAGGCSVNKTTLVVTMTSGTKTCKLTAKWAGDNVYAPATATQSTNAELEPLTIAWAPPLSITYGARLSSITPGLRVVDVTGANVKGTFAYTVNTETSNSDTILPAGIYNLGVSFTPTLSTDYAPPAPVTGQLTVNLANTTTTITRAAALNSHHPLVVTVYFTVAPSVASSGKEQGTVLVTASTGEFCTGTLPSNGSGKGSCPLTFALATETPTLTAVYSPTDNNNNGSTSASYGPLTLE
jgi:hypothetical protein